METWALLIGVFFGVLVLAKLLSVGAFSITKKPQVRIDHDWMISREREARLKAAAIWRGYKR